MSFKVGDAVRHEGVGSGVLIGSNPGIADRGWFLIWLDSDSGWAIDGKTHSAPCESLLGLMKELEPNKLRNCFYWCSETSLEKIEDPYVGKRCLTRQASGNMKEATVIAKDSDGYYLTELDNDWDDGAESYSCASNTWCKFHVHRMEKEGKGLRYGFIHQRDIEDRINAYKKKHENIGKSIKEMWSDKSLDVIGNPVFQRFTYHIGAGIGQPVFQAQNGTIGGVINHKKQTIMNKLSLFAKKLVDSRTRKFVEAGFLDSELNPTYELDAALKLIQVEKLGAELEAAADERIAEIKKGKE